MEIATNDLAMRMAISEIYGNIWTKLERRAEFLNNMVVLEGPDGCGKTAIAKNLITNLAETGIDVEYVRSAGSTEIGEQLREIILNRETLLSGFTQFGLFFTSIQELLTKIRNNPRRLFIVDRYFDSTIVYQYVVPFLENCMYNRHNEEPSYIARVLENMVTIGVLPFPKITFFVYRKTEEAWKAANTEKNVFEKKGEEFYYRVFNAYSGIVDFIANNLMYVPNITRYKTLINNRSLYALVQETSSYILHVYKDEICPYCKKLLEGNVVPSADLKYMVHEDCRNKAGLPA